MRAKKGGGPAVGAAAQEQDRMRGIECGWLGAIYGLTPQPVLCKTDWSGR